MILERRGLDQPAASAAGTDVAGRAVVCGDNGLGVRRVGEGSEIGCTVAGTHV